MECVACKLPLLRGPDNTLYGPDELADLQRALKADALIQYASQRDRRVSDEASGQAPSRLFYALCGAAFAAVVLWVWSFAKRDSPDKTVLHFTRACLAGDWEQASEHLDDDAVQRAEFTRWRIRYFASLVARHRPQGDRAHVEVSLLQDDAQERIYDITMTSPFIGRRRHIQLWRQTDGLWRFDAAATLVRHDKSANITRQSGQGRFQKTVAAFLAQPGLLFAGVLSAGRVERVFGEHDNLFVKLSQCHSQQILIARWRSATRRKR
jgi:hypothetical protein